MKKIFIVMATLLLFMNTIIAQDYRVIEDKAVVYSKPNFKSEIGHLTKGYEIKSLKIHNEYWSFINEGKIQGYIQNRGNKEIRKEKPKEERSYAGIIGLIVGLIIFGLILNTIYGKEKTAELSQYTQNPFQENTTYIYKSKSVAVAIILTLFFGPIGMLYSTIRGALAMMILPLLILAGMVLAFGTDNFLLQLVLASGTLVFFSLYWFICIIWGAVAASNSIKVKKL